MASSIAGITAIITVHPAVGIELRHVRESGSPISLCIRTIRILQPNQPRQIVGYGTIGVIRKARARQRDPGQLVTILSGSATSDRIPTSIITNGLSRFGHRGRRGRGRASL